LSREAVLLKKEGWVEGGGHCTFDERSLLLLTIPLPSLKIFINLP